MLIGSKISDPKFYSALLILAGLCLSLVVFSPAKTHAAAATFDYKIGPTPAENLNRADLVQSPLLFEQNQGQSDRTAKFIARGNGYTLYLTRTEAVFSLKAPFTRTRYQNLEAESKGMTAPDASQNDILRMSFTGANRRPAVSGETEAITKSNYYRGSTRIENIPNYRSVNYSDLYDGVDAVFYGDEANQLEYDFVIAPNADANQIQLTFQGAECLAIDGEGDLAIKTAQAEFIQPKPFAYLEIDGQRHEVPSRYVLTNDSTVKFELGPYDHSKQLVIDPKVSYSTYLGGTGNAIDVVQSIKVDAAGNVYATGGTESSNFPTLNPRTSDGSVAVFIAKISPNGQTLLYTTFLDGSGDDGFGEFFHGDRGNDLALDASGNVYVAGQTESDDFPISTNAYQTYRACNRTFGICAYPEEAFVTKLSPTGTMIYSTYLGGRNTDFANGIAVDSAGKAYVTGGTSSGLTFPKKNEYEGTGISGALADGFLTVFTADGSDITYSTGLGGNNRDDCNDIAIDSSNNVYITGETESDGQFPVKNAFQGLSGGGIDAFVAKFNPSLSGEASLIYSTFLGGAGTDEGLGIAVDAAGSAHVTGSTGSFNFPLQVPIRSTNQINEAFVTVLDPSGISLDASTFLGGSGQDRGNDIEVDAFGNIYVTGNTTSSDFPLALPFQSTLAGGQDAFFTKLKFGVGIKSSSYLGGSNVENGESLALQNGRVAIIAGRSASANLPVTPGVIRGTNTNGDSDGFITRLIDTHIDSVGVFRPGPVFLLTQSTTTVVSQQATLTSQLAGSRGVSGDWDGDGTDSIGSFSGGVWKVRDQNFPVVVLPAPFGAKTINFGASGDLPVVGDWNGDGIDTPGVFRPSTGQFTVTDSTSTGPSFNANVTRVTFGLAGDRPIAGDWDGDGKDSVAVYRPSTGQTFFTNADVSVTSTGATTLNPGVDLTAFLGIAEDLPVGGDWNGDGIDSLGLWRPSTAQFFLSDDNANLRPTFIFGITGDQPIVGDWDGKP